MRISDWSSDVCSSDLADAGGSERLLSGVGQPDDRGARARGLDLGGRSRRSGALAALLWWRRRIGTRLRLSAAGAVRSQWRSGGRAQHQRIRARGALSVRQFRDRAVCRRGQRVRKHLSQRLGPPVRGGDRRALLYQFRAASDRRGDAAQSAAGRRARSALYLDRRSEEHTSELQSLMRISYAVFCLKKKNHRKRTTQTYTIN